MTFQEVGLTDYALLGTPLLNKGTAFTDEEREAFLLRGLLPPYVATIEEQALRAYTGLKSKTTPFEKYIYLRDLQDSNETLFHYLVTKHITEILPLIYTPTVADGCIYFSKIYRRPRGLFISYLDKDRIDTILSNPRFHQTEVIVVTDGERILGVGDQGAGGMGIPIGKLSLYSACAGIHPATTLPILLDVGTDNPDHLKDPLYVGWRHERIRGKDYDDFIEKFVNAIKKRFPKVLLQWEDFAQINANPILERYREKLCTFNDDIQGTAAVVAGTLFAAIHVTKIPLKEQRIVVVGGGSAGCGVSKLILQSMIAQGLPQEEARKRFFIIDKQGLLTQDMEGLALFQKIFAQDKKALTKWVFENSHTISLKDVIKNVHPTLLIGASAKKGIFTKEIIQEMASHVEQPIIFPLSNPISCCEATPEDLNTWTFGKALIGAGSPFPPILKEGKLFRVDQPNNAYIFPGFGLGIIASGAKHITDRMFLIAAETLSNLSPSKKDPKANLLPPFEEIREISFQIALAVAKEAVNSGQAKPCDCKTLEKKIRKKMWTPAYLPYKRRSNVSGV